MLKKIGYTLLCAATTIATNAFALTQNHMLQAGITIEYELPPNSPQLFTNYMFWAVEANCKITTEDESNVLFAEALAKKGKMNDIPWSKGDTLRLTIHNNENLKINADSGAQVRLTNEGQNMVRTSCSS